MEEPRTLRVAIVGCGAITEKAHLPALAKNKNVKISWLVDTSIERARRLARWYKVPGTCTTIEEVEDVELAFIATPHLYHASMSEFFLKRGVHVHVEKPMALGAAEADRMIRAAKDGNALLSVGMNRRFYQNSIFVKRLLANRFLGSLTSFHVEEGSSGGWPYQTPFMMSKELSGGGVLIDTGSHTLDRILWWLEASDVKVETYRDNSFGGVEADCTISLRITSPEGIVGGTVELSRTRDLRNRFEIVGERGMLQVPTNEPTGIEWIPPAGFFNGPEGERIDAMFRLSVQGYGSQTHEEAFQMQVEDLVSAIRSRRKPATDADSVQRVVRLIETCYSHRQPLDEPWVQRGISSEQGSGGHGRN